MAQFRKKSYILYVTFLICYNLNLIHTQDQPTGKYFILNMKYISTYSKIICLGCGIRYADEIGTIKKVASIGDSFAYILEVGKLIIQL